MRSSVFIAACVAFCGLQLLPIARAADQPASEASIRELFEVTHTRKLLDDMMSQADAVMQNAMKQGLGNQTLTPAQQAIMDDTRKKLVDLLQDEMNWEKMEPEFIAIYRQTLTEQEVAGALAFYRTEVGQAVIAKMPIVMQHSLALMQKQLFRMQPKIQQIEQEAVGKLQACCPPGKP